jgi:formylglycine-generating enzyme required for sulfatase activity
MVVVPKGRFVMGSPEDEPGRSMGETRAPVDIRAPFAVGRFAVTFSEWEACANDGGCNGYHPSDEGWGKGLRPVINVNWNDASAYVQWLSRKTGKTYRLLRDSEREYVARAGTTTSYWWGSDIALEQANFDIPISARNSPEQVALMAKLRRQTVAVDSFNANAWGLYTVHGNVWEWTSDCALNNQPAVRRPRDNRQGAPCGERIARGGSWNDFANEARSAARIGFASGSRNRQQGFRVARSLP